MKYLFVFLAILISTTSIASYTERNLLQKEASEQQLRSYILPTDQWVKYPAYSNRIGWDSITGNLKNKIIQDGEAYLNYEWKVVKATDYLEFERSGSRAVMETPFNANNTALGRLVYAELAEGKGRFMEQIINGVWHACEMSSWVLSAHLSAQKSKRSLPDYHEEIIDLGSGQLGSLLSWTWYFLHEQMDKTDTIIASKLRKNIRERILIPYMARSDYWWQALNYTPGTLVNNWNPWCNSNVLICFLLLEDNADARSAAVYKTMQSVDKFINYVNEDGACEEGPSYWGHAAGKLYDYLQILYNATGGRLNLFSKPMIKNMGEYIAHSYVGNGWVVNFADASAKGGGDAGLIFRYGEAVNSNMMQRFAAYLQQTNTLETGVGIDFFRTIENWSCAAGLSKTDPESPSDKYTWYPQTQFCYMKDEQGFFLAAKGGYNNESHNHNDVGTFSLYLNTTPMFVDAGVGTYTRQTFSNERYSIWTMQSNYHNLPMINGKPEQFGAEYRAKDVQFDERLMRFSMDISGAYNADASVKSWKRTYDLSNNALTIEDAFTLAEAKQPNQENFLTWAKPDITTPGTVVLEKDRQKLQMIYDAALFTPSIEEIPQTDPRLSSVWGEHLYRLTLTAKKMQVSGKYKFIIRRVRQ
ncbi:heparinase II/III family protein [Danxiaibacter flavus]|uniref:Heparinase II/III family protein n=1 Tax=Danxiaibacter flavus TaxID=3049108 RepID=A0ABV3ZBU5_9BACT|nr:heparinase II/III family protein [Chitinophagaceae bacterium DXS]